MVLFKKEPKEEDLYEEEVVVRKRPKSKAFRDLTPENRGKRKEPKKPWGKWERILVLSVLVSTFGTSLFLAVSSRGWKLPGLPRLSVSQVSLPFGEKKIVIEGNAKDARKAQKAKEEFAKLTKDYSGIYGFYVVRLTNGSSYGINEADKFQAASLIKLPVMAALYMEAEKGNLNLDSKYSLKSEDKVPGSGSLYGKPAGYEITYRNLVNLMGKQSDNTAFNIARKILGEEKINQAIRKIGMVNTSLAQNETTPEDIATFFEKLWRGNVVSLKHRDEILESLTDTIYEAWIPQGIPQGVRVSHKFGRELHVVNDAGIIFTRDPFILVVMSKKIVEREADELIPKIARMVYEIETGE